DNDFFVHGGSGSVGAVVGRFLGDLHVVDVGFSHAGCRDLDKLGLVVQFGDGNTATIAHGRLDAAHQLVQNGEHAAALGDAAFNALGDEFVRIVGGILEVAISRAGRHGTNAAHAPICLVRAALIEDHFAGGLFRTGKHAA